ncbi:MAG: methionine synthase [Actinobacteria bacterium]|nr:methionine synthase [Actinomycetota bacterium]
MPEPLLQDAPPAGATAVGSMPGTSVVEAVAVVVGELGQGDGVPHLPELPARGPGADMVGRTAGLLAEVSPDLAVETTPDGWRFADAPGREMRRAQSFLGEDLDAWEEALDGFRGWAAASVVGPWTMAAAIELSSGERAVRDAGACRDLAAALAHAAVEHVVQLQRRVPGSRVLLQIDEPSLPAVLLGSIATQSGRGRYAAIEEPVVEQALAAVVDAVHAAGAAVAVHCCAQRPPLALLRRAGADALSVDLLLHSERDDDEVGELLDRGGRLIAGIVPGAGPAAALPSSVVASTVEPVVRLGHRLGVEGDALAAGLMVSPTCGMAGASPAQARRALALLRAVGRGLRDEDPGRDGSDDEE